MQKPNESITHAKQSAKMMKHVTLGQWQRWLAKLSLILVAILLFEAYKDILGDYTDKGLAWIKQNGNSSSSNDAVGQYEEKLTKILQDLQVLQKQGQLKNVKIPGKIHTPSFAFEGKPISVTNNNNPKHVYSPRPCSLGEQPFVNWEHKVTPRFQQDPTKFIFPILKNEPIDQLMGLRQSILLAIKLNRTLALPYFHNHNYGGLQQYNPPLPAALKVNVDLLRHFISVISIDQLQKKCGGKFDAAFLTGHIDVLPGIPSLLKAQTEMQMKMLNTMNTTVDSDFKVKFGIPTFPKNLKQGDKISITPKKENILRVYPKESSKYKCVVHPFPLSALDVYPYMRKAIKLPNHKIDLDKMKEEILYSAIWFYTQPPEFTQTLALEIIEDVMHAREVNGVYNFLCLNYHKHSPDNAEELELSTLRNIANSLLKEVGGVSKSLKVSGIYIASPVSKQGQAKEYRENLKLFENKREVPIYSGEDIITKWRTKYFSGGVGSPESMCSLLEDDTQDILSVVEMHVCVEAAVFIRSIGSSWAANVQANRVKSEYTGLDMSMKEILEKYRKGKKKPKDEKTQKLQVPDNKWKH